MTRRYRVARVIAAGCVAFAVGGYVGWHAADTDSGSLHPGPPATATVGCVTSHPAGWTIQTCTDRSSTR